MHRLLKPNETTVMPLGFDIVALKPDRYLNHGEKIMLVNHEFEIRHTPGHTEGSISIINHKDKIVFSGDALFNGSIGRTDFPGGSFETLMNFEFKFTLFQIKKILSYLGITNTCDIIDKSKI